MKIPSLFSKSPKHRRFSFTPRFYDEQEYERKEREERIRQEVLGRQAKGNTGDDSELSDPDLYGYRTRIAGSFKSNSRRSISGKSSSSTMMIRFMLFAFMLVWVITYLQYGNVAFYGLLFIIPIYLYIRRGERRTNR